MPRRQRKRKRRKEDMAAYRELVRRILAGEVRSLWWTAKRQMVAAAVRAGMIYIMDPDSRTERTVTAGTMKHFSVEAPSAAKAPEGADRMAWATD